MDVTENSKHYETQNCLLSEQLSFIIGQIVKMLDQILRKKITTQYDSLSNTVYPETSVNGNACMTWYGTVCDRHG